jgi:hypothetical protein
MTNRADRGLAAPHHRSDRLPKDPPMNAAAVERGLAPADAARWAWTRR